MLCCLFPFGDHGKTAKHLDHVKGVFASNGGEFGAGREVKAKKLRKPLLAPQNVKSLQNYEIMQVTDSHFMARKYTPFLQVNDKL